MKPTKPIDFVTWVARFKMLEALHHFQDMQAVRESLLGVLETRNVAVYLRQDGRHR